MKYNMNTHVKLRMKIRGHINSESMVLIKLYSFDNGDILCNHNVTAQ